ncbi:V-type ATP synthase subunit E family protein [Burkholderia arboris]|uniref:hypothetical protein n=1 Tax=Burkholderia arboris TaxID=488730 RepID=UPI001CF51064|nr:hypothetical protein [Burkholderia arboris]MCA8051102.1 hypothetical protein [Burkholderia arboris]
MLNNGDRPKRALIAYCALADRLKTQGVGALQSLIPFFAEACTQFAGELFDAQKFSAAVAERYGIKIPRLAALGLAEHLVREGILEEISNHGASSVYRYLKSTQITSGVAVSPVSEAEVGKILASFSVYCRVDDRLATIDDVALHSGFLSRLLNIDSMKLLARREVSIAAKKSVNTLTVPSRAPARDAHESQELHLDFLTSQFLLDLRDKQPTMFDVVSDVAFASMAAEAITCFLEPSTAGTALEGLTVFLDSPLLLDMLGVNDEYAEYGKELLETIKTSGAHAAVLEHCVIEAETAVYAQLQYLRSGVNQFGYKWGLSSKPDLLNALVGNVGQRAYDRLGIDVQRDPDLSLFRRSPTTVAEIDAEMDRRMQAWKNAEAKEHDRKSVWSMLTIRDSSSPCPRICDARWLLLSRNTALVSIANDAWDRWLKGTTKHSSIHIDKWAPVAMSDKQFAGYVWARGGGANASMPRTRLLAHCSAAVRPRADVKARAYNLVLDLTGKDEADDLAALLEDREGARALMRVTRGDPEDVTPERLPFIIEKVKLAAGEFAAARVREESEQRTKELNAAHEAENQRIRDEAAAVDAMRLEEVAAADAALREQKTRHDELAVANLMLQQALDAQKAADVIRMQGILKDGLNAGTSRFSQLRWATAIMFGLLSGAVGYVSTVNPIVSVCLAPLVAIGGFWFVPEFLESPLNRIAMRKLRRVIMDKDETILIPNPLPDFRRGTWSAIAELRDSSAAQQSSIAESAGS